LVFLKCKKCGREYQLDPSYKNYKGFHCECDGENLEKCIDIKKRIIKNRNILHNFVIFIGILALFLIGVVLLIIPAVKQDILNLFINYPQSIIAAVAVVVSTGSILIARESLKMQRKHNALSVKPIANITESDFVDTGKVGVRLENVGTGSMIIQKMKTSNKKGEQKDYLLEWMTPEVEEYLHNYTMKLEETTLKAGGNYDLLSYIYDPKDRKSWDRSFLIRKRLKDLIIQVEYADIYGNIQPEFVYPLNWFDRSIYREKDFKNIVKSDEMILSNEWEIVVRKKK